MSEDRAERVGEPAIELRHVEKAFRGHLGIGRKVAVDGLTLEVRRGEVFGLLGPNGAGKTTTLKMIIGLMFPDRGSVGLLGGPPRDAGARARVGFLPENPYFYDYLTGEEFLDFYARLHGFDADERRDRVARVLARVGLEGRASVPLRKFSKGMVQRVGLAQAILHDPELVILDEPMSGLDPLGRREVRDIILELKASGRTVLFSSHILQDAEMVCDRVGILDQGRMRYCGELQDVVSREPKWFEVVVEGAVPDRWQEHTTVTRGDRRSIRAADVSGLTRLLNEVELSGGRVVSVWPRGESLEDLFLREIRRPPGASAGAPPSAEAAEAGGGDSR